MDERWAARGPRCRVWMRTTARVLLAPEPGGALLAAASAAAPAALAHRRARHP